MCSSPAPAPLRERGAARSSRRRLRRSDPAGPGLARRRAGKGFYYLDESGQRITDPAVLERIRSLTIPPAWRDVWICPDEMGHIQATGVDARGRKQYRYHERWRQRRDREKFEHMLEFARSLPGLRERVRNDLRRGDLSRERVLACAVRLLDVGFFRIGSEGYAEENDTYGLATIQRRHVRLEPGGTVTFDYTSKSGQRRVQSVRDPAVRAVVEPLKRRRGGNGELLAWREGRRWIDVRSVDINAYIKEVTGGTFTAKDFRTWNATVLAAIGLAVSNGVTSEWGRKRAVTRAVKEVARYLGNTPAVCRSSYIDPRVLDCYRAGEVVSDVAGFDDVPADGHAEAGPAMQGAVEAAVLELLDPAQDPARAA